MSWFLFIPQGYFHWIRTLVSSTWKMAGISFWLLWFLMRNSNCLPLIGNVPFLFFVSKFLVFSFLKFNNELSWWEFLWVYCLWGSISFLNLQFVFCKIWENCKHYLWEYFFSFTFFLFSFCNSDDPNISFFIKVLKFPEVLFIFQKICFLIVVKIG